ncbi:MAG: ArsR family transcriptional regulator [Dehalococcoidia bacterium]
MPSNLPVTPADPSLPVSGRHSTKDRLLGLLRRHGARTVDDLVTATGLAAMTVRQHLAALERDGLVQVAGARGGPGRPRHVYSLTDAGEETFPKRYDRFAAALLRVIGDLDGHELLGLTPAQKQELALVRLAEREAGPHLRRLARASLPQRVAAVTNLLQAEGGMAEWERTEDGYEIRDYNCVYRRLAQGQPSVCLWHLNLLGRLLGAPVRPGEPGLARGGECCRFAVSTNGSQDHAGA